MMNKYWQFTIEGQDGFRSPKFPSKSDAVQAAKDAASNNPGKHIYMMELVGHGIAPISDPVLTPVD